MKNSILNSKQDLTSIKAEYDKLDVQIYKLTDLYISVNSDILDLERETEPGTVRYMLEGFCNMRHTVHHFASLYTPKENSEKLAEIAKKEADYKADIEQKRKRLQEYKSKIEKIDKDREDLIKKSGALYRMLEELKKNKI